MYQGAEKTAPQALPDKGTPADRWLAHWLLKTGENDSSYRFWMNRRCSFPRGLMSGRYRMSAEFILLSAVLVGVPISIKYVLAFEMRNLVSLMKAREREVAGLTAKLNALDREYEVVIGAAEQVRDCQKWAATRRDRMADELVQVRRGSVFAKPEFTPTSAPSLAGVADYAVDDFAPQAAIDDRQVAAAAEA